MNSDINDVSDTAFWVAVYRAEESKRPDALFKDPFAERLAGQRGKGIASKMKDTRYVSWSLSIRTHIIDDYIAKLTADGIDAVINLGAGLDARPYRLNLPKSLHWLEVDYPHMMQFKNEELKNEIPRCQLERISLDLANDEARKSFLTKISSRFKKALILTEGVVPYLSVEQVGNLADELRQQPSFKFWILDYFSPKVMGYIKKDRNRKKQMKNAPFLFHPKDWFGFFDQHGWKLNQIRYLAEESIKLRRAVPSTWLLRLILALSSSKKRAEFQKFLGYVILEPK